MAIADRISAMYDHVGEIYDTLELGGDTTQNKNIVNINTEIKREYKDFLAHGTDELWNNWEKVSGTGTELSLNNTMEGKMKVDLKGNTQQNGEPTPSTPIDIQVVSGDNTIKVANGDNTEYEEYPITLGNIELCKIGTYQDKIAKSTGKNLFDKDNANILNGWVNSTTMRLSTSQTDRLLYIPCEPNTTYTISRIIITSSFRVATYNDTPMPTMTGTNTDYSISDYQAYNSGTSITITTNANAKYLIVHYGNINTDTNINQSLATIMINKGTTALPYEPYGIGWYLNKQIGKVVLNGSEPWVEFTSQELTNTKLFGGGGIDSILKVPCVGLSNYFKNSSSSLWSNDIQAINVLDTQYDTVRIRINKSIVSNVTALKAWLSNHNTILYYILKTATNIEITDTILIEQLNNLENANSYNNTTNVSQVNDDMPFILDLTALKEMA